MWGWDPSQGEGPAGGTPTLLPSQSAPSPPIEPHPVVIPDVQGLKQQFQSQQNLLAQIKETLRENDADRSSKEKQLEMYANKLSQIKNRSKNAHKRTADSSLSSPPKQSPRRSSRENLASPLTRKVSKENVSSPEESAKNKTTKGKMTELKRRLAENKLKFEEQTEREMTETKKIESMVEQIKTQVKERDVTIHNLQKTIETPPSRPKVQTLPRKKEKNTRCSQWTQTVQISGVSAADLKIGELEATIVDLEDTIQQQSSVITSRTEAVALLTGDLSKKNKSAVDNLEETRLEMRALQSNFVEIEMRLKSDLLGKDNRLTELEGKIKKLESVNAQLNENCTKTEVQLSDAIAKCIEKETTIKLLNESKVGENVVVGDVKVGDLENKINELNKELDASNKLMIRLKLEHKNKLKEVNKSLDLLKKSTIDSSEILRLSGRLKQLDSEKLKLESKIAELEEEKASEVNLNQRISDLENMLSQKDAEIMSFEQLVASYEAEKLTWQQCIEDQNILVDNLNTRIQNLEDGVGNFEPFEIPGDAASRQFDLSNKELQKQIEDLVAEKQNLLDKLKNFPSGSSTDSLTFEKVDMLSLEAEIQNSTEPAISYKSAESIEILEENILEEKQKSESFVAKIKELEDYIQLIEKSTESAKGSKEKRKIQKLERDLFTTKKALAEEKDRVNELNLKLEDKEKLLKEYVVKIQIIEKNDEWSCDLSETQRKCLSLENSLLELSEHCERLRKENIELSEEKVRQKRAEEEMAKSSAMVPILQSTAEALDDRIKALEAINSNSDLQESLEYSNVVIAGKDTEIFNLQSSLADRGHELDSLKEELAKTQNALSQAETDLKQMTEQSIIMDSQSQSKSGYLKQLKDTVASQEQRIHELEDKCTMSSAELQRKSEELSRLLAERHRLQVSIETVMAENALVAQAKISTEEKLSDFERQLQETNTAWQQERRDWEAFVRDTEEKLLRERDEALMKGEEAEKVLQKTWAERNDLIQSKQDLLVRYSEMETAMNNAQFEKNQTEAVNRELKKRLDDVGSSQDLIDGLKKELELRVSELDRKKDEYNNLALKAKKFAANLKLKVQIEKELTERLNVALSEKELLTQLAGEGKEMAEKWAVEGSEKIMLLKEKELIQSQNKQLINEKEVLMTQCEELKNEREMYIKEAEAAFAEKCTIEEKYAQQTQTCSRLELQITALEKDRKLLAERLQNLEEQWTLDKTELMKVTEFSSKIQKDLDNAQLRLSGMEQTFELEERENEALLHQKAALLQEQQSLQQQCREREERISWMEKEQTDLINEIRQLKDNLQSAKQQLADQHSALNTEKQDLIKKCQYYDDTLTERLKELETITNEAKLLRQSLQEAALSADNYKLEIDRLLEQENCLVGENINYKNRLKSVEEDYNRRILELEQKNIALQQSLQLEESQKIDLLLQVEQNGSLLHEITQCKDTIQSLHVQLEERNNALNTEVIRSNQVNDDLMNLRSLVAENEAEIQRLTDINRNSTADETSNNSRRKKSVTFKTDDGDYIRELRGEVSKLQEDLSEGREKIVELEMELVKEKNRGEVQVTPLMSATESVNPSIFFSNAGGNFLTTQAENADPFSEESLAWDDGWGAEGQLEEAHALSKEVSITADPEKLFKLEKELEALVNEKEKADEDLRVLQVKYSKLIKKLKEQKIIIDRLQGELKMAKSGMVGDLDAAIMDELKEEIKRVETRESEVRKELAAMKTEKETWLKRIDLLNAGNERFLELKERQDSDVAVYQQRNASLVSEIASLQDQLKGPRPDDSDVIRENRELHNLMEGLEWKISELSDLVDEKDEELTRLASKESNIVIVDSPQTASNDAQKALDVANASIKLLEQQLKEANNSQNSLKCEITRLQKLESELAEAQISAKTAQEYLSDVEAQLSMLAVENETLQGILNSQKQDRSTKAPETQPQILQYFQKNPVSNFFEQPSSFGRSNQESIAEEKDALEKQLKELNEQLAAKQLELVHGLSERELSKGHISELNNSLLKAEDEMQQLRVTFENKELDAKVQTENILETLALKEAELDSVCTLLKQKEEEVALLRNESGQKSSGTTDARLNEETWLANDQLREKEDQIQFLTVQVQELQKAYNDAKSEIERLLSEEQFRSETPLEDKLEFAKRSIDLEKADFEAALRAKDKELSALKESLIAAEAVLDEVRNSNELVVQQLKAQLRHLDSENAHSSDEKDTKIAELRVEVTELQDLVANKALEVRTLRDELTSLNRLYEGEVAMIPAIKNLLDERGSEMKKLSEELHNLELIIVEKDAEIAELRLNAVSEVDGALGIKEIEQKLKGKEEEVLALKETLESVHAEMSQFRSFDKQMKELQMARGGDDRLQKTSGIEGSLWSAEESSNLAGRLQSDLDTALYMLHQRDVRCEELTFELMQLLEERDTLQLRLSTVIRTHEEFKAQVEAGGRSHQSTSASGGNLQNLSEKISELHTVGYARDKNIQDESLQRHREQMALLNRDSRGKTRPVLDV